MRVKGRPLILVEASEQAAEMLNGVRSIEQRGSGQQADEATELTDSGRHEHGQEETPLTLSMAEAAALLGIGVSTAYRLCARGEFPVPVLRIGGMVKVSRARLRDYVDGGGGGVSIG